MSEKANIVQNEPLISESARKKEVLNRTLINGIISKKHKMPKIKSNSFQSKTGNIEEDKVFSEKEIKSIADKVVGFRIAPNSSMNKKIPEIYL